MPTLRKYQIFISHAWCYSEEYKKLIKFLNMTPNFSYTDSSVPEHDPLDVVDTTTRRKIELALTRQISQAQIVIILAGMYAAYSDWMQYEINEAMRMHKPIIAVKPWGQQRIPQAVHNATDVIVGWNTSTIVQAIRDNAK